MKCSGSDTLVLLVYVLSFLAVSCELSAFQQYRLLETGLSTVGLCQRDEIVQRSDSDTVFLLASILPCCTYC